MITIPQKLCAEGHIRVQSLIISVPVVFLRNAMAMRITERRERAKNYGFRIW